MRLIPLVGLLACSTLSGAVELAPLTHDEAGTFPLVVRGHAAPKLAALRQSR